MINPDNFGAWDNGSRTCGRGDSGTSIDDNETGTSDAELFWSVARSALDECVLSSDESASVNAIVPFDKHGQEHRASFDSTGEFAGVALADGLASILAMDGVLALFLVADRTRDSDRGCRN